jgi:hypothetical protein
MMALEMVTGILGDRAVGPALPSPERSQQFGGGPVSDRSGRSGGRAPSEWAMSQSR